ncbi:MAG: type IX secretion system membrane protein PorP/SprF [Cytophagaceae bacterium]
MKKILLVVSAAMMWMGAANAQQNPQYSMYMINPIMVNPAVSGTEDYIDLRAGYRNQWTGFDGAPKTFYVSGHMNLGKAAVTNNRSRYKKNGFHGIGTTIQNDVIGPTSSLKFNGVYSYHLKLGKELFASAGVSAGIHQFSMDGGKLITGTPGDPLVSSYTNLGFNDVNMGAWVYNQHFYAGLSVVQVLPQKIYDQNNSSISDATLTQHMFLMAGYRIPMGYDFTLIPSFAIKAVSPAPVSFDLNCKVRYQDKAWAGVSYRNKDAIAVMVGVIVNNTFDIAYAYDYTTSNIRKYSGGSHEIVVGYRLRLKGQIICPNKYW